MPSKKSGGKREVEKKHRQRDAKRPAGWLDDQVEDFKKAKRRGNKPVDVLDESIAFLRVAMHRAANDPGVPPEQAREQVSRIAANLGKLAEPKKIIEELGAELREAHEIIEGLKHAAQEPSADPPRAQAAGPH